MAVEPISANEFARSLQAFVPYEAEPHLAVAVSGGADSVALLHLAVAWSKANAGSVTALTVDHGLRAEAADEARWVADLCNRLGIRHEILAWCDEKPATGLQAAARVARYRLLDAWCRDEGVLHLLAAHHADDQAETVLLRMEKGSGPDGLAAMSPVRELANCRLLRPLLDFPKARLVATLETLGEDWIEDPSNRNPAFARVRIRRGIRAAMLDTAGLTQGAGRMRQARAALETATAQWLGRYAGTSPYGDLGLDTHALADCEPEIRLRVLARAAAFTGGKTFPPGIGAVERLSEQLRERGTATLGGALFKCGAKSLLVCREARNLPAPVRWADARTLWDGRFEILRPEAFPSVRIEALGSVRLRAWPVRLRPAWMAGVRPEVLATLPSFLNDNGDRAVPQPGAVAEFGPTVRFSPKKPLSGSGFAIA